MSTAIYLEISFKTERLGVTNSIRAPLLIPKAESPRSNGLRIYQNPKCNTWWTWYVREAVSRMATPPICLFSPKPYKAIYPPAHCQAPLLRHLAGSTHQKTSHCRGTTAQKALCWKSAFLYQQFAFHVRKSILVIFSSCKAKVITKYLQSESCHPSLWRPGRQAAD